MSAAVDVFLVGAVQMLLMALPAVAGALVAIRLGVRNVPVLTCVALAAAGAGAMLTFWVYFAPPSVGPTGAYLVFFGSLALTAWSWPVARREGKLLRRLATPLALWVLATAFVASFGFLYGGTDQPIATSAPRFSTDPNPFATDNIIPGANATWLHDGHPGPPPDNSGWQFGDRPPLQSAFVLMTWVFGSEMGELRYQMLGIALQQLWIVGAWALLLAAAIPARTRALALVAALASDVVIVNGFYVWPKLVGAGFLLAAVALLVSPGEPLIRKRPWTTVLFGALCGLALLSHGSNVFGVVPVLGLVLWRGLPDRRWLAAGAAALLIAMVPWVAFQQIVNPPSNRLLKLTLAGVVEPDDRGTVETVVDQYRAAGVEGTIENKSRNLLAIVGGDPTDFGLSVSEQIGDLAGAVDDGQLRWAVSKAREIRGWHVAWWIGLLPLGLPLIALGRLRGRWRDGPDWWLARVSLVVVGIGLAAFVLLMFGNTVSSTLPGSLSYAIPLLATFGLVAALRATYPRVAIGLVAANVLTTLLIYTPFLGDPPGSFSVLAALLAVASLAGVWAISLSGPVQSNATHPG